MQDLGYELPRIPIPRTPVNKGKDKDRSVKPRPFFLLLFIQRRERGVLRSSP
jgi:hypothetical protein